MRALLGLGLVLCAQFAGSLADASAVEVLRECAARATPRVSGVTALAQDCPQLRAALADLGYLQTLSDADQRRLTPAGLESLAALGERYQAGEPSPGPGLAPLRGIVDGLARERLQTRSWWDVAKSWLRNLLDSDHGQSLSWFDRALDTLSTAAGAMKALLYGLLGLVILAAAFFVLRELQATGVLRRKRRSPARFVAATALGAPPREAALGALPLGEQPAMLLRLLVACLSRKGRLHGDRHLTHRELAARAILEDEGQRRCFARLAGLAENQLYGAGSAPSEGVARIVDDGRELLAQIERVSPAA